MSRPWSSLVILTLVTLVTGLAYGWMRYLLEPPDPFTAFGHPWQPWMLDIHVLAAPALLFVLGWVWGAHRPAGERTGAHRGGWWLLGLVVVMAGSAYLREVIAGQAPRVVLSWIHGLSSIGFTLLLVYHGYRRAAPGDAAARARSPGHD
ncbi:MAG TPA: hypothetical protein ENK10_00790 [Acidobacteria bacterium]|nr:hypothetical protein [Acidobacteriota bacterium]